MKSDYGTRRLVAHLRRIVALVLVAALAGLIAPPALASEPAPSSPPGDTAPAPASAVVAPDAGDPVEPSIDQVDLDLLEEPQDSPLPAEAPADSSTAAAPSTEATPGATPEADADASSEPTTDPTERATSEPTTQPTAEPTSDPTADPTTEPTADPTTEPTETPADGDAAAAGEPPAEPEPEPSDDPAADEAAPQEDTDEATELIRPDSGSLAASAAVPAQDREYLVDTGEMETDPFTLAAVTWVGDGGDAGDPEAMQLWMTARTDGEWSEATELPINDDSPDLDTAEGRAARGGTEPVFTDTADAIRVWITAPDDVTLPEDLRVDLIDPGTSPMDAEIAEAPTAAIAPPELQSGGAALAGSAQAPVQAAAGAPRPTIRSRANWGADESIRGSSPSYGSVDGVIIHHTAGANGYSQAAVPGIIRGVYAYHVLSRGWSDVGYNVIIDRFGGIWEGRHGGLDRAVQGAHASGYNHVAFGVSLLGTYSNTEPGAAAIEAFERVIAWKFTVHNVNPKGRVTYPGRSTQHTIAGHRDVGQTECPGDRIYNKFSSIRNGVEDKMDADVGPAGSLNLSAPGSVQLGDPARFTITWTSRGANVTGRVNLQRWKGGTWIHLKQIPVTNGRATTSFVPTGDSTFRLRASSASSPANVGLSSPWGTSTSRIVRTVASAPSSFRLQGSGWGHGVGMSQYGALGLARVGHTHTEILEHFYGPARRASTKLDPATRVQLLGARQSVRVEVVGGSMRVRAQGAQTVTTRSPVRFSQTTRGGRPAVRMQTGSVDKTYNGLIHLEWTGTRYWSSGSRSTEVRVPGADGGSGTGQYRHGRLLVDNRAGVNVVAQVRLNDEYLYGLDEVPSSWPAAALQAQVTAGRTYALRQHLSGMKASCGCHVYDEIQSQRYRGWKKEGASNGGARWRAAVDATLARSGNRVRAAHAMYYDGALIDAVYSSSSGGRTLPAEHVWGTKVPYLRTRDDRWARDPSINPNARWTTTVSQAQMRSAFNLPDVVSVRVASRNIAGSVKTVQARAASGTTRTLSGAAFRSALGLKSAHVLTIT